MRGENLGKGGEEGRNYVLQLRLHHLLHLLMRLSFVIPRKAGPKHWNRLYHQKQDGTFEDATQKAGLQGVGYGMGVAVGDYDNDGYEDLYVTAYGGDRLYHNNGDGTDGGNACGMIRRQVDKTAVSLRGKFQGAFLPSRNPSYVKYAKTSRATQFIQNGTAQPPSDTGHLKTSRDKWASVMSKKIALAIRVNVL